MAERVGLEVTLVDRSDDRCDRNQRKDDQDYFGSGAHLVSDLARLGPQSHSEKMRTPSESQATGTHLAAPFSVTKPPPK